MKNSITFAQQAKRIQNKYKGRTDKLSMDSMHRELAALEQQQEALREQMNLTNPQEMHAWGGPGGYVNQPDNNLLAMGGLIKRADGTYSQRGLWDNIRANKGSGKKPTKQMLEQEKKIKQMAMGGYMYADGGKLPEEVLRSRLESHMSPEEVDDYINEYGNGGYTVKRSSARKGKTHVVIGPDGTKKYFGDSNLGQHPNDPERKKAFYARHADNIKNNPYFKAYANATWAYGGGIDNPGFRALPIEVQNNIKNNMAMGGNIFADGGGISKDKPTVIKDKSGNIVTEEYLKKYPIIYTNNPKDPRIGFYNEPGNLILYKKENPKIKVQPTLEENIKPKNDISTNKMEISNKKVVELATHLGNLPNKQIDNEPWWFTGTPYMKEYNTLSPVDKNRVNKLFKTIRGHNLSEVKFDPLNSTKTAADSTDYLNSYRKVLESSQQHRIYDDFLQNSTLEERRKNPQWQGVKEAFQKTYNYSPQKAENFLNEIYPLPKKLPVNKVQNNMAMGGDISANDLGMATFGTGGGIHIDPSKKGTFTAAATKHGKSVQGFASQVLANKENYSPAMVKKANFAKNAAKWHHAWGGKDIIPSQETIDTWNQMYPPTTQVETNNEEFQIPYDQMANTFGSPYARNYSGPFVEQPVTKIPITKTSEIKIPQSKISNEPVLENRNPQEVNYKFKERKQPFNYAGLAQLAGPLMDLYYGIKGPDKVNFDRVKAQEINLAPGVTADLVRRAYSPAIYAAKQQNLGQGSYLNMLSALSSKAGEDVGKSYLQSKLAQEQFNAEARNQANTTNAQIGMQESIARQQERDAARSAVTEGAQKSGKGIATLALDPRLESSQAKQNKIMRALIKSQYPNLDIDSIV